MEHRLGVDLAQDCRCFAHCDRIPAKGFNAQPQTAQIISDVQKTRAVCRTQTDDLRDQERLRRYTTFGHLVLQLFIDQPFMGGVLIHDNHPGLCLGHDVILVNLAACHPQRQVFWLGLSLIDGFHHLPAKGCGHFRKPSSGPRSKAGPIHLINAWRRLFRLHRPQGRAGHGCGCAMARLRQSMAQARHDQPPRQPRIAKADFGFGRVHIHIHKLRITVNKQSCRRMPIPAEEVEIGGAQGTDKQLVLHRATVDIEKLRNRSAPRIGGQCRIARQVQPLAHRIDRDAVFGKLGAKDIGQPGT
mmetsp:Transcript_18403/g.29840  ORF Transcript_18403/g.29840 Transcript_18403/m.29840 type:complete len:301 (-) Transcript_18403:976-1878(-)